MTVYFVFVCMSFMITGTHGASKLMILHSPSSLKFQNDLGVNEDSLKEMYCVALGLSTGEINKEGDMVLMNPFDTPEAAVYMHIEGTTDINSMYENSQVFSFSGDIVKDDLFEYVLKRIKTLKADNNVIVNLQLSDEYDVRTYETIFGELFYEPVTNVPRKVLIYSEEEDAEFLRELLVLKAITKAMKKDVIKPDRKVDFFHFKFNSLRALVDHYGSNSDKAQEARKLLNQEIDEFIKEFIRIYEGNVLFTIIMSEKKRFKRNIRDIKWEDEVVALASEGDGKTGPKEVQMIFWTCVTLSLSVLAIVRTFMAMDVGKDSIVYRLSHGIDKVKQPDL